jgi:hypothetical protein
MNLARIVYVDESKGVAVASEINGPMLLQFTQEECRPFPTGDNFHYIEPMPFDSGLVGSLIGFEYDEYDEYNEEIEYVYLNVVQEKEYA